MNARLTSQTATESLDVAITGGGTTELVAVISAMVLVACGAAALLLTTPSTLQSVANAAPPQAIQTAPAAERTFHERYPVGAAAGSIETPTF